MALSSIKRRLGRIEAVARTRVGVITLDQKLSRIEHLALERMSAEDRLLFQSSGFEGATLPLELREPWDARRQEAWIEALATGMVRFTIKELDGIIARADQNP